MSDQQLQAQIQTLQKQVKELQDLTKFIRVTGNGANVVLEPINAPPPTTLHINFNQIQLNAAQALNLNAGAVVNLKGGIIKLNNGSKPAARVGSKTAGTPGLQTVIDGSPTVMLP